MISDHSTKKFFVPVLTHEDSEVSNPHVQAFLTYEARRKILHTAHKTSRTLSTMADALSDSEITPTSASANLVVESKRQKKDEVNLESNEPDGRLVIDSEASALRATEKPRSVTEHIERDNQLVSTNLTAAQKRKLGMLLQAPAALFINFLCRS